MKLSELLLEKGWPETHILGLALKIARDLSDPLTQLEAVRADPTLFVDHAVLGEVAQAFIDTVPAPAPVLRDEPVELNMWGRNLVDSAAVKQIEYAAKLPIARAAALMPDAHVGYGLPIGGVLATEKAVIPYAVGVDIACRMRLSILPQSPILLEQKSRDFGEALLKQTRFGAGAAWENNNLPQHAVLDEETWRLTPLLRSLHDKASRQIGTSGGGNHFVEFGSIKLYEDDAELGLAKGTYLALLSHSGSRGIGAQIANYYTKVARDYHQYLPKEVQHLAWLELGYGAGAEYWQAMNLAGRYAAANHEIIHQRVLAHLGLEPAAFVENHHNFAWEEKLADGTEVIVHRKGATPAGVGVMGVIPGSMADFGYVVRGKGNASSLNSAAHGAGRRLSRSKAFAEVSPTDWKAKLNKRNITLFGGALDESPQAYKPIKEVMAAQEDLVDIVAQFMPRMVRMADKRDGGRGRRRKKKGKGKGKGQRPKA